MSDETLPSDDASAPRWLTKARAFFAAPGVAHALRVMAGALLLMVPILLNGRPFPFTDTATYFQSGYYVIQSFTDRYVPISDFSRSYLGARSPFYGLPLTGLEAIGTLWLVVALQALAAAQMLDMMARAIGGALARTIYWTSIIALMLVSSLPLFIGFVMPDLSAAFAAIAIALLVFYPERAARWERIGLWIALTAALTFHLTHMFVAVFAMPAALGLQSAWAIALPQCLYAIGHGVHQPCSQAAAVGPFAEQAGAASALAGFVIAAVAVGIAWWLGQALDGTVRPLVYGVAFWSLLTGAVAWTLVRALPR